MNFRCLTFVVSLLAISPACAQWQVPVHSVPIGLGGGNTGFNSAAPGTAGQPFTSNGASTDPSFQALANGGMAQMPANTVKCNPTASAAIPLDCTPSQATVTLSKTAAYSPVSQDCGASFPLTGGRYTVTVATAGSYANPCTFVFKNVETEGTSKTISVAGVPTILYPGQSLLASGNGSSWATAVYDRWKLTGAARFYVRPDGSDSCDGLTNAAGSALPASCAVQTANRAALLIGSSVDVNSFGGGSATIQHTCGSPPCTISTAGQLLSIVGGTFVGGPISYLGDCGTPTNVKISPSTVVNADIQITFPTGGGVISVGGFELAGGTNANYGMYVSGGAQVIVSCPMQIDAISSTPTGLYPAGIGIGSSSGAYVYLGATIFYTASIGAALSVTNQGHMENTGANTINTSNTPAWGSGFIFAAWGGSASFGGMLYNGTGATGNRCIISKGGVVTSNGGIASMPGSVACSVAAGTVHDAAGDRGNVD